jgi:agmatinase
MTSRYTACVIASFFSVVAAREITFPPVYGISQQAIFGQGEIDITTGSAFAGLTTYANLPYVHCLAGEGVEVEKYDIAILGAPFDTVSWIL